ncbi:MAG: Gx transporter family protein [Treponema sp.]|jgi:heptaprenyl diphosphate synthase|nr:Gx transporter family protein [Treponema sp.]
MARSGKSLALLGSLCLFLSTIEYLIPKPLPFMRIGLANLPLLLALDIFPLKAFAALVLIKIFGQAILTGTLFSYVFLFSLAGTAVSAAAMYALRRLLRPAHIGFTGISVVGACLSNAIQLVLARFFIFGASVQYLVPPFLASGLVTGFALGLFCEAFCAKSKFYAHAKNGSADEELEEKKESADDADVRGFKRMKIEREDKGRLGRRERWDSFFLSGDLFVAGFLMALLFLFTSSLPMKALQFFMFAFFAWVSGKKNNFLITIFVITGIVFFNLLAPYGKVLAEWGPFRITEGSLLSGIRKAIILEGLVMLSGAFTRPGLHLPGRFGALLGGSFSMLERIRERRTRIKRNHLIEGIDQLMLELEGDNDADAETAADRETPQKPANTPRWKSRLLLGGMVVLTAIAAVQGL